MRRYDHADEKDPGLRWGVHGSVSHSPPASMCIEQNLLQTIAYVRKPHNAKHKVEHQFETCGPHPSRESVREFCATPLTGASDVNFGPQWKEEEAAFV